MFGLFSRKAEPKLDLEEEYSTIKLLVENLPDAPGWEATYEKEISEKNLKRLEAEGIMVVRKMHTGGKVYYKISPKR